MKQMTLIGSFLVFVVSIAGMASVSHAWLIVQEDPNTLHKVVFDDAADKYWIWDMAMYENQTYQAQRAAIEQLSYYHSEGWRMATREDIDQLLQYTAQELAQAFGPGSGGSDFNDLDYFVAGRIDEGVSGRWHESVWVYGDETYDEYYNVRWESEVDNAEYDWLGAWVVADRSSVIPEPTTLILLSAGLIGLLALRRRSRKHQ